MQGPAALQRGKVFYRLDFVLCALQVKSGRIAHCNRIHKQCYHSIRLKQVLHSPTRCLLSQTAARKTAQRKYTPELQVVARPPWKAEGQGKARRLFEADQGPSKRVISLARDQTMLKLTSLEFKERLADVLSVLPELPLSGLPPKMLAKLVLMPPGNIAHQLVLLQGLFKSKQDINELLLKEPSLLTASIPDTAMHVRRLEHLLCSPRKRGGQHPYERVDFDDFIATHPEFLIPENVVLSMRALCIYLGRAIDQNATIQDYVTGNPGMLLKGYKSIALSPVLHMSSGDTRFNNWWLAPPQQ